MRSITEILRQLKAVSGNNISRDMKQIYSDFFRKQEEAGVFMLHREDLYMPGEPHRQYSEHMVEMVQKHAGHEILDIGCGIGVNSIELNKRGFHCVGIEVDESYVEQAKKNIEAYHMKAEKLDFPGKSFDTVIMLEVLEHIQDPDSALLEIQGVTRKNLILSVPNISALEETVGHNMIMHHFFDSTHVNFFTKTMLERFLKKYFPHVEVEEFGQFFSLSGKKLYYHLSAIASL
jgi:2-polyprenyl-3-methyl-5-hydroxy-6-metoxy-1,4-benzoquinol methylase